MRKVSPITFEIEPGHHTGRLLLRARCEVDLELYQTTIEVDASLPFSTVYHRVKHQMRNAIAEKLFP